LQHVGEQYEALRVAGNAFVYVMRPMVQRSSKDNFEHEDAQDG